MPFSIYEYCRYFVEKYQLNAFLCEEIMNMNNYVKYIVFFVPQKKTNENKINAVFLNAEPLTWLQ